MLDPRRRIHVDLRERLRRCPHLLFLALFYAIAASQVVTSFVSKWTTVAEHGQYSLPMVLDGQTARPYAYRVLMPAVVNTIVDKLPAAVARPLDARAERVARGMLWEYKLVGWTERTRVAYAVAILLDFLCAFALFWALRELARRYLGHDGLLLDVGPVLFAVLMSITFRTENGFIYDFPELLLAVVYLLCVRRPLVGGVVLIVAVLNKESAILLPWFAAAVAWGEGRLRATLPKLALQFVPALFVMLAIRIALSDRGGSGAEFYLWTNIAFWLSPTPWLYMTSPDLPLIALPFGSNILVLALVAVAVFAYWREKPAGVRAGVVASLVMLTPLFLIWSYAHELRAMGLAFPFLFLASMHSVGAWYEEGDGGVLLSRPDYAAASSPSSRETVP
jgi:uncharacterized membrane protein